MIHSRLFAFYSLWAGDDLELHMAAFFCIIQDTQKCNYTIGNRQAHHTSCEFG